MLLLASWIGVMPSTCPPSLDPPALKEFAGCGPQVGGERRLTSRSSGDVSRLASIY